MSEEKKEKQVFINCPKCGGSGKGKMNFSCFNCGGLGMGRFWGGYFLYFKKQIDRTEIFWRRIGNQILAITDFLSLVLGVLGVGSLVWWVWSYNPMDISEYFYFWQHKNIYILFFWIGIISFSFFYYKTQRVEEKKYKIKTLKRKNASLPNNWNELKNYKNLVNVADSLGEQVFKLLEDSYLLARKWGHKETTTLHLFASLLKNSEVLALFVRLNTNLDKLTEKIKNQLEKQKLGGQGEAKFSPEVKKSLVEAFREAYQLKQNSLIPLNLIDYCVAEDKILYEILWDLEVTLDKIRNVKSWFRTDQEIRSTLEKFKKMARFKPKTAMNKAYTAVATPN